MLHSPNRGYDIQILQQESGVLQVNPEQKLIVVTPHV